MARLILLDRDGVINFDSRDFVKDADEFQLIPGAVEAIAEVKRAGYLVGVCTNQSGIGRGLFTREDLDAMHRKLDQALAGLGAELDDLRVCPHAPDAGCECRKPQPRMLIEAMAALGTAGDDTIYVGDSVRDVEAAHAAGCHAALVRTGNGASVEPLVRGMGVRWVGDDLAAFAQWARERQAW